VAGVFLGLPPAGKRYATGPRSRSPFRPAAAARRTRAPPRVLPTTTFACGLETPAFLPFASELPRLRAITNRHRVAARIHLGIFAETAGVGSTARRKRWSSRRTPGREKRRGLGPVAAAIAAPPAGPKRPAPASRALQLCAPIPDFPPALRGCPLAAQSPPKGCGREDHVGAAQRPASRACWRRPVLPGPVNRAATPGPASLRAPCSASGPCSGNDGSLPPSLERGAQRPNASLRRAARAASCPPFSAPAGRGTTPRGQRRPAQATSGTVDKPSARRAGAVYGLRHCPGEFLKSVHTQLL